MTIRRHIWVPEDAEAGDLLGLEEHEGNLRATKIPVADAAADDPGDGAIPTVGRVSSGLAAHEAEDATDDDPHGIQAYVGGIVDGLTQDLDAHADAANPHSGSASTSDLAAEESAREAADLALAEEIDVATSNALTLHWMGA